MDFKIYQIFASFVMLFFTIGIVSLKIWAGKNSASKVEKEDEIEKVREPALHNMESL
ncbi:hypothetical protein MCGE09_00476 [Thaumarchaeota archaeon SCGC AB-539-E09]|nr:hypothetical protein MCGE09_00476 [Thaumarchaeota archaeon SCGC AB-539-E09]